MPDEITIPGTVTMYYQSAFIGRDGGQNDRGSWGPAWGLTNWIADSFELLNFRGYELPFADNRTVNSRNRSHWMEFTNLYLDRIYPSQPIRICFRKATLFKDNDQWEMFPHPDDAEARDLTGRNGEIPIARVWINKNPKDEADQRIFLSSFTSKVINSLDENDLIVTTTVVVENRDDYDIWDLISVPSNLTTALRKMSSTQQSIDERMGDWVDYLNWMYELQRGNEWGAKIVDVRQPTGDDPYYIYTVHAPYEILQKIKHGRNRGARLHAISPAHSTDPEVWKRSEESQDGKNSRRDEAAAGNLKKIRGDIENAGDEN